MFLVHGETLIKVYGKKYRHNARKCIKERETFVIDKYFQMI